MTKLKCNVEDCYYQNSGLCSKHAIKILGARSKNKKETKCQTFIPRIDNNFAYEFAKLGIYATEETDVYCAAKQCVYQKDEKCSADRIEVACDTKKQDKNWDKFDNSTCTMCKTFESSDQKNEL